MTERENDDDFFTMDESEREYWEREPTEEELKEIRKNNRYISKAIDAAFRAMKSASPVDPETGEAGAFVRFAGSFPRVRPVYRTPSGEEFFRARDKSDEEQKGGESGG